MFFRNKQVIAAALAVTLSFAASSAWAIGAIAVDDEEGTKASEVGYGVGYGSDKASAQREAVKQCKAAGNENCKVKVWYETCGAYAVSSQHFGIGYGSSKDVAVSKALDDCGGKCRVVVSDCE